MRDPSLHEKIATYFLWLEDRGCVFPIFGNSTSTNTSPNVGEISSKFRYIFIFGNELTVADKVIIDKTLSALHISANEVQTIISDNTNKILPLNFHRNLRTVLIFGISALRHTLGESASFRQLRGQIYQLQEAPQTKLLVTYHPNDLARNENNKKAFWLDLKKAFL